MLNFCHHRLQVYFKPRFDFSIDFNQIIIGTNSGKTIVLESKGDDRDNNDSEAKCRLGQKWAELAGKNFLNMMVFDQKEVKGAYSFDKAKAFIREM